MEQSFLAWLRGRQRTLPQVAVGIGDDAAVIDLGGGRVVATVDQIADGVDFLCAKHPLEAIGRKAMAVNLSDMAAMAARPVAALVTLSLPHEGVASVGDERPRGATQTAAALYEGILAEAQRFEVAIAGGDITCYEGPLAITITLLGEEPTGGAWLRSGAQEGDAIVLTGPVGGSILGRHLDVQPRVREAARLHEQGEVHAAIDISDGLSLDLDRLCAASGVGAELELDRIPIHDDARRLSQQDGVAPLEHAWGDGEDFELILAIPPTQLQGLQDASIGVPLHPIGTFTGRTGLWGRRAGSLERLTPRGYLHGRR